MATTEVHVGEVAEYTPELSVGIGLLIPDLVEDYDGRPVSEELLREIIESKRSALFVAQTAVDNRYVGTATVNLMTHPMRKKGYLDYLVVSSDPEIRGTGIGRRLYLASLAWSLEMGAERLEWTTREAQKFYLRQGATIKPTTFFQQELT